jgi:hypothetical protein
VFKDNPEHHNGTGIDVSLSKDEIHHLLSNARRRAVINILQEESPITKRELIDRTTEREFATDITRVSSSDRKRVHVSLHQCHLPKLENHGVIHWRQDDKVSLAEGHNFLVPYLEIDRSEGFLQRLLS